MSDSLSPSGSSIDLVIDDDLDGISVTDEDLTAAEAKCGLPAGRVLARPGNVSKHQVEVTNTKPIFKFGISDRPSTLPITGPKVSSGDPRIRFKPTSLPSTSLGDSKGTHDESKVNVNATSIVNIKRTVQNKFGSSSFGDKQPPVSNSFKFGLTSPGIKSTQVDAPPKFTFGSSRFSPNQEDLNSSEDKETSKEDVDMKKFLLMKETQKAKMKMETEKMLRIEKMIQLKKQQQMIELNKQDGWLVDTEGNRLAIKEIELAKQAKDLQKQTAMVMQMQQNMLMQNNTSDQERRRLEDQKRIIELQLSVKNLERLIGQKQGLAVAQVQEMPSSRPVWERVGARSGWGLGGVMERVGIKRNVDDSTSDWSGEQNKDDIMNTRKKRFTDGRSDQFNNNVYQGNKESKWRKKSKYHCAKLPDDLVLTEITDQGPVKKEDLREESRIKRMEAKELELDEDDDDLDRYEFEGELDADLVLTEFSEDGPVRAGSVDITSTSGK